jgi:hypothetical protein
MRIGKDKIKTGKKINWTTVEHASRVCQFGLEEIKIWAQPQKKNGLFPRRRSRLCSRQVSTLPISKLRVPVLEKYVGSGSIYNLRFGHIYVVIIYSGI